MYRGLNWHTSLLVCLLHWDDNTFFMWTERKWKQFKLDLTCIYIQWIFLVNYFSAFLACWFCVSHISHKSVGDGEGLVDRSASWAVITTAFGHLYKTGAHNQYAGNVHKIYWAMTKENCKLDHQMVLSNFKTHFTVS